MAVFYEAKSYDVKTGTGVAEARALCPHIVLVEARPKLYVDYHHRIVAAVNGCIPVTNVMSVDEMACRLMGRERALPNATQLVFNMKQALSGVGETLRCSVGLAPNCHLAKLASDMMKPDAMTVLIQRALYCLKLRDLVGVSRAMEQRINAHGITTVEQLCQLTPQQMRKVWGSILGERMWHWLRGADFHAPESERKSLGKQHVLAPEYRSREQAFRVEQKMLQFSAANLRKLKLWAGGIGVYVAFVGSRYGHEGEPPIEPWKAQARIGECRDTFTMQRHLAKLWEGCPVTKPLQVGVWLFNLMPDEQHTLLLFDDDAKEFRLSSVVDELNDRYGNGAIYFAGIQSVRGTAQTKIAFTSVPELGEF